MAQSGFTPIQLYYSTSAGNTPLAADLANGELAINTNDGVLYYKDSGGVVQVIASGSSVSVLAVEVATTTNLASLSGLLTVDGVTLTAGQRVLVKDQTLSQNNGVYLAAVGAWTRSIDCNSSAEIAGRIISVRSGSTNGGEQWATTFKSTDTLGTTAMAWYQVALQNTAVTFSGITDTGNLTFTGTGNRITGDFSNATLANRVFFQSSTTNGATHVNSLPNGTSTSSSFRSYSTSDPDNSSISRVQITNTAMTIASETSGTGTYVPMLLQTNATTKLSIAADTTGTITIGGTAPRITGDFSNATIANRVAFQSSTTNGATSVQVIPNGTSTTALTTAFNNSDPTNAAGMQVACLAAESRINSLITGTGTYVPMTFYTGGSNRLQISTSGKVYIGGSVNATVTLEVGSTDAILLPKGTTAEQPTGVAGYLRFNTSTNQFEGYNGTAWASVGGAAIVNDTTTATDLYPLFAGATSGTALTIYTGNANLLYKPSTGELTSRVPIAGNGIVVNSLTVATSYTIAAGFSGSSAGPITVASGVVVTVSSGSRWVIS